MPTYDVTIKATVLKTIRVEAECEEGAVELAHEQFSVLCDNYEEDYKEDAESCVLIQKED